jgi:uncharacterized protein
VAGASLFALLDDIASVLDDVAILTKVATKKTAGVLGDDLALNAQQVSGVRADRELPVVWAVAKGSLINKAILVPAAIAISAVAPWAIVPLLMLGGLYLCYEGVEKIWHKFTHRDEAAARREELAQALEDPKVDLRTLEKDKIKGAIRTDFILSAEIIVIALGTVAAANFGTRVAVLVGIGLLMTVGVYGLVAGIVKLDDAGLHLLGRTGDAHEGAVDRRHGRDVPRGRRNPRARHSCARALAARAHRATGGSFDDAGRPLGHRASAGGGGDRHDRGRHRGRGRRPGAQSPPAETWPVARHGTARSS